MTKKVILLLIPILIASCKVQQVQRSSKNTKTTYVSIERKEYIKLYNNLAIKEMKRSGIPASITLAQAMLESDNGNSTLAQKANNHFGIKCHNSWKGPKVFHDDDKRNECFRKYKSVYSSYIDHSNFIANGNRYQFLFDFPITDYKSWAKGLQKAGYATSRTYATLLIKIIEDNQLYVFDKGESFSENYSEESNSDSQQVVLDDVDNFTINLNKHTVKELNRIDYIIVKGGDTFESITEEFGMLPFEIFKYNELKQSTKIQVGLLLFLQPKRTKAEVGSEFHIVKEEETMYSISQVYGIKIKSLYGKNLMEEGTEPSVGQKIWLRKIKSYSDVIDETPAIEGFDGEK
ncbi:MAG: glucosaminidase domain-containing protein [Bacteroidales bacterium]|nr:glucosaminidase domain-containing protein [Bacteroidales bacterium]